MVKKPQEYSSLLYLLKEGKFKGLLLLSLMSIIVFSHMVFNKLRYTLLKFSQGKKGREIIIEINNRYKMYLNFEDKGICFELMMNKTREVFSTAYIQKIITENMIIIDIGANIGYYALLESQLAARGHVFAIEPVLGNYNTLIKNITLNNCQNISTYNVAIGNSNGYSEMYIYDKSNWSSFTKIPGGNIIATTQVPVFTLDTFIESHLTQNPHFIRMDVEGFEYEILMGMQKTLQMTAPLILMIEMHPHLISREKMTTILTLLKDNGFKVKSIFGEIYIFDHKYLKIYNQLQSILHKPSFGYAGNNYRLLEERFAQGVGAIVFLEKST